MVSQSHGCRYAMEERSWGPFRRIISACMAWRLTRDWRKAAQKIWCCMFNYHLGFSFDQSFIPRSSQPMLYSRAVSGSNIPASNEKVWSWRRNPQCTKSNGIESLCVTLHCFGQRYRLLHNSWMRPIISRREPRTQPRQLSNCKPIFGGVFQALHCRIAWVNCTVSSAS